MRSWKPFARTLVVGSMAVVSSVSVAAETKGPAKLTGAAKRGEYLVTIGGCHDCHTPLKMTDKGPQPDMSRMLSGHPEQLEMPPAPVLPPGPWMASAAATLTAWSGPWGVSFTANLTPDKETGLGNWTEQNFIDTLRSGRHLGRGRPILPPMPWPNVAAMTDQDLKAVYAFLRTLPPIKNKVPAPRPPPEAPAASASATAK